MCGRFTQTKSRKEVLEQLGEIELPPLFHRRYNIAPTQNVAIIRSSEPRRTTECIWGFRNPKSPAPIINARSETLAERPLFKDLLATNRCLVPADGFYEWKGKQPYYFQTLEKQLFAFAGLWRGDRCVILTRAADENMRGIHHRMPVILKPSDWQRWLSPAPDLESRCTIVNLDYRSAPCSIFDIRHSLTAHPVSSRVNRAANDDPACIEKIAEQADLFPDGE